MAEPPPLAKVIHAIPQMDLMEDSNGSYSFHFNATNRGVLFPYSSPFVLVLYPLIVVLSNLLTQLFTKRKKQKRPWYFHRVKEGLVCLIICLVLVLVVSEYVIHTSEMNAFQMYKVPAAVVAARDFVDGVTDAFTANNFKIKLTAEELNSSELWPYKRVFAKFASEIFQIHSDMQNTFVQDNTMLLCTLYMEKYYNFVWHRYFMLMLGWFGMFIIIAYKPHHSVAVAVCGILYCTGMGSVVLASATALAAYCQSPAYLSTVSPYYNVTHSEIEVNAVALDACLKYLQRIEKQRDLLRDAYFNWVDPFHQLVMEINYELLDAGSTEEDLQKDLRYRYVKDISNYLNDITKSQPVNKLSLPVCLEGIAINVSDYHLPHQTLDSLCEKDNVMKWLVWQLMVLLFACLAYITLAMMNTCDVKYYEYYWKFDKKEQHKSKLKARKRCSLSDCEPPSRSSLTTPSSSSSAPPQLEMRHRSDRQLRFTQDTSTHLPAPFVRQRDRPTLRFRNRTRRRSNVTIIEAGQGENRVLRYRTRNGNYSNSTHSLSYKQTTTLYRRNRQDIQFSRDTDGHDIKVELQKMQVIPDTKINDDDGRESGDERRRTF